MRYVIIKNNIDKLEVKSRQEYLYDVFKIYTTPVYHKSYVEIKSIFGDMCDVIFICGHNNQVFEWLRKNEPHEKNIVLITCYIGLIKTLKYKDKNVFYTSKITSVIAGANYGFDFDITNEEIDLYNCKKTSINKKLKDCFERV